MEMTYELCRWWTLEIGKTSMQQRWLQGRRQESPEKSLWKFQPCLKQEEQLGREHEPSYKVKHEGHPHSEKSCVAAVLMARSQPNSHALMLSYDMTAVG